MFPEPSYMLGSHTVDVGLNTGRSRTLCPHLCMLICVRVVFARNIAVEERLKKRANQMSTHVSSWILACLAQCLYLYFCSQFHKLWDTPFRTSVSRVVNDHFRHIGDQNLEIVALPFSLIPIYSFKKATRTRQLPPSDCSIAIHFLRIFQLDFFDSFVQ